MRIGRVVYFIQQGMEGPIKVGIADDPFRRCDELQTGNSETLYLRRIVRKGTKKLESEFHKRLRPFRLKGEWFNISLDSLIELSITMGLNPILPGELSNESIVPQVTIPDTASERFAQAHLWFSRLCLAAAKRHEAEQNAKQAST